MYLKMFLSHRSKSPSYCTTKRAFQPTVESLRGINELFIGGIQSFYFFFFFKWTIWTSSGIFLKPPIVCGTDTNLQDAVVSAAGIHHDRMRRIRPEPHGQLHLQLAFNFLQPVFHKAVSGKCYRWTACEPQRGKMNQNQAAAYFKRVISSAQRLTRFFI